MCCMLLAHNPYRLPQHYKRHICGSSCSCKHQFLWISPIFEHWFCLNCMGAVHHWQSFWQRKIFCFIGQCWYFSPQWTPEQGIMVTSSVRTVLVNWEKYAVMGFRRWREYILAPEWKPDLHVSCSIAHHST